MRWAGTEVGDTGWDPDSCPWWPLPQSLVRHGEGGGAHLLQAPHLPGVRTVSSSWVCPDAVSLLNRAGGDGHGRADELLVGPTRKVPVTMGTFRGSAVWKEPC